VDHDQLIQSLRRAVESAPADAPLRLHLAGLLLDAGATGEAITHLAVVLAADPGSGQALDLMRRAVGSAPSGAPAASQAPSTAPAAATPAPPSSAPQQAPQPPSPPAPQAPPADQPSAPADPMAGFDWDAAARDLGEIVPPRFVDDNGDELTEPAFDIESATVRLSDVGGMSDVKQRLQIAFLAPMRNPQLSKLYGKSLKGGLLLYGPPGCGKTYIARAVAGELEAKFFAVTLADVLDMYIGRSERNLTEIFAAARRAAPCVLFFDEIDALGQKRSQLRNNAMRGVVNQLLSELDGVGDANEGVFVLAATNAPWDVDVALRRPGRLDRTLLVLPPDTGAREAILRHHLKDRPIAGIDVAAVARRTEGYSGADLAHICDGAAEIALIDSAATGAVRMIEMRDLEAALSQVRPSVGPWMETARNVAMFANEAGAYDDLLAYLKKRKAL
jgi:AAA+ superfamily predicted ATPase